ncbi:MAG: hypothetical protein FD167_3742 [bacterium]|nr:MAG: hypothetical protein FD167_3742 [bacterium]
MSNSLKQNNDIYMNAASLALKELTKARKGLRKNREKKQI